MLFVSPPPFYRHPTILVVSYFTKFHKYKPVTTSPVDREETWKGHVCRMDTNIYIPENSSVTFKPKTKANFLTVLFVLPYYCVKQAFQFEVTALFMGTLYLDSADPCLMNSF
jgi:hypothetical protein